MSNSPSALTSAEIEEVNNLRGYADFALAGFLAARKVAAHSLIIAHALSWAAAIVGSIVLHALFSIDHVVSMVTIVLAGSVPPFLSLLVAFSRKWNMSGVLPSYKLRYLNYLIALRSTSFGEQLPKVHTYHDLAELVDAIRSSDAGEEVKSARWASGLGEAFTEME